MVSALLVLLCIQCKLFSVPTFNLNAMFIIDSLTTSTLISGNVAAFCFYVLVEYKDPVTTLVDLGVITLRKSSLPMFWSLIRVFV